MTAPNEHTHPLLDAARAWYDAGYCVIPSHEDGGKRPFGAWKQYQTERPQWDQVRIWLASGRYTGIGILTGATSGNVEMVEIEGPMTEAVVRLNAVITESDKYAEINLPDLLARIARGCVEQSAGGGLHLFIRVTDGPALPNTKLAHDGTGKVIAETRGEGGFVVVAPTTARRGHPEGAAYLFINGGHPANTVDVTSEERDLLHLLFAQALDEAQPTPTPPPTEPRTPSSGLSAFDDYRARVTWRDILEPRGWTYSHTAEGRDHWTRPGKPLHDGTSATTIEDGPLYCFSTSTPLPAERGLSKGQVYAHLDHGGDESAAARALAAQGYGEPGVTYSDLPPWTMPDPQPDDRTEQLPDDDPYVRAVRQKFAELRVLEDARVMLATSKLGDAPPLAGLNLGQFLAQPDEDTRYRVNQLWPAEGRVMLAAAAKSGKTTMVAANLIPSLVDGRQFLGRYDVAPVQGRVVLFNMEVGDGTLRRWMRDCHVDTPDKVVIVNLRGKASALTLASPNGRKRLAAFLQAHDAEVVILDPLAPVLASLGLNEDKNAEVATFFAYWSEAMDLAGVKDDLVVHHTGHAGQRSRGASRLLDEPDAIWTLTKDTEDDGEFVTIAPTRYLAAYGRDVDLAAEALAFDASTRSLTLTGAGKTANTANRAEAKVIALMSDGRTRSASEICNEVGGSRNPVWQAVQNLKADGVLTSLGKRGNGELLVLPEVPK